MSGWDALRAFTPARIGLGRAGNAQSTASVLEATSAHAVARDAVHSALDVAALLPELRALGLGEPAVVASAAPDRGVYLTRPDLGRTPGAGFETLPAPAGGEARPFLGIVLADGLSAEGVQRHAAPLLRELLPLLGPLTVAPPVVATQARVALGDHVGQALGVDLVLVLIGERPGLSSADSLGAYLTWRPQPGIQDSARNCVSNIRPPHGLDHASAARTIHALIVGARELGGTGVTLKEGTVTLP